MNVRRLWAIAHKEFLHVLRDPRSLGMAVAIPVLMLVLFGYALTLDVDHVPMVVWDQSGSPTSREFLSRFRASRYFDEPIHVRDYRHLAGAIDRGEALLALVIPGDFARCVDSGRAVSVQAIVDGSDSNTAAIVLGYIEALTSAYAQQVTVERIRRAGNAELKAPLDLRARVWFNADLESKNYIVPGLIAVIMMVIAALLTSLTIAREWERGTMEQLISTPVRGPELIVGKLLPYFAIGMLDVLIAVVMGQFLFAVPLRGSLPLLFATAAVFLVGGLSLGLLVSTVAKNQAVANQLAMVLTFLPAWLLSGFTYPVSNMPRPVQLVTYLVPSRYFVSLLKGIYLKGVGLSVLWPDLLLLAAFGAALGALTIARFKKKLD